MDKASKKILSLAFSSGRKHDFRLFKESRTKIHPDTLLLVDSGYQGIQEIHAKSRLPKKKSKKHPLTREDKVQNRSLAQERVENENVIAGLKKFRILSGRYRNRRRRFALRYTLIAGIYNLEIQ